MTLVEGRGVCVPSPVMISVSTSTQKYLLMAAVQRDRHREYSSRRDRWGRGLISGREIGALGAVSKSVLVILVGLVGEHAVAQFLKAEFGAAVPDVDLSLTHAGDGGFDLEPFGAKIQVKTRRAPCPKTLIRRVTGNKRLQSFNFNLLVSCEWKLDTTCQLLGWNHRSDLYRGRFARSKFDHFNIEIRDDALLPMSRLLDHLHSLQMSDR
ncbi:hypothetical protein LCGC14_1394010 [marine sediment metagenome]|uniref:Uncharacterized protein n=1 Tax=marine sediment metagenome TaxID=412755 RepID=A0A0F9MEK5_9ZZZZ